MKPVEKKVEYKVTRPCSLCGGKGRQVCHRCGGNGRVYVPIYGSDQTCPSCGGSGINDCTACGGSGKEESYEWRWETEWVDEPESSRTGSYSTHSYTPSYSSSSYRSGRSSRHAIHFVIAGIVGAVLGNQAGMGWLGAILCMTLLACVKGKIKAVIGVVVGVILAAVLGMEMMRAILLVFFLAIIGWANSCK